MRYNESMKLDIKKVLLVLFVLLMVAVGIVAVNAQKSTPATPVKPTPAVVTPTPEDKCPAPKVVINERCQDKPVPVTPTPTSDPAPEDVPADFVGK